MSAPVSRLAAAVEALALGLLLALALGLFDGLRAVPWPGEPWTERLFGAALLDLVLLTPVLFGLALAAALRPRLLGRLLFPNERRPPSRRTALAALLVLAVAFLAGGRLTRALTDAARGDTLETWRLMQPLPRLRTPADSPASPSIVLISVDTLRHDALEHMPRLRARAQTALRFTQARSAAPWTLPAMASVLTGQPPEGHQAGRPLDPERAFARTGLSPETPTLPQRLRQRGFVTAGVLTNPFLSVPYGLTRGLDRAWDLTGRATLSRGLRRSLLLQPLVPRLRDDGASVSDRALRALSRLREGRFFLWVHYLDPHAPYSAQDRDAERRCTLPDCFGDWGAVRQGERVLSEAERARVQALYQADLGRLDLSLDRLLSATASLPEGTLVVLVSDHGEAFGGQAGVEHGGSFFDELVRVPLMVWGAGVSGEVERSVGTVQVFDAVESWVAGEGLGPLGVEASERPVGSSSVLFGAQGRACVFDGVKLIEHGGRRVYDVLGDPLEASPLDEATLSEEVQGALQACLPAQTESVSEQSSGPSVHALRGLGYVE